MTFPDHCYFFLLQILHNILFGTFERAINFSSLLPMADAIYGRKSPDREPESNLSQVERRKTFTVTAFSSSDQHVSR